MESRIPRAGYIPENPHGRLVRKNSSRARLERGALGHRHPHGATIRRIESAVQTLADSHRRSVYPEGMDEPENQNAAGRSAKGRRKHGSGFQRIPKPPKPQHAQLENPDARFRLVFPDASNDLPGEPIKITWRRLLITLQDQKPPQPFECSRIRIHAPVKRPGYPSHTCPFQSKWTVSTWQCSILRVRRQTARSHEASERKQRESVPWGCGFGRRHGNPKRAAHEEGCIGHVSPGS